MEPQTQNSSLFQLNVDANVGMALKGAGSWAKVLGILGILFGVGFIAIGILVQSYVNNSTYGFDDYGGGYRASTSTAADIGMGSGEPHLFDAPGISVAFVPKKRME